MSLTIEFYSAEPQELKALFAEDIPLDAFVQKQQTFPQADFSFHLLLPDDLDNLCQMLSTYHPLVPLRFQDVCVEPLWDDGLGTESLAILSEQFARALEESGLSTVNPSSLYLHTMSYNSTAIYLFLNGKQVLLSPISQFALALLSIAAI